MNSNRTTVVSVRLDDTALHVLDLLVESGLLQSRSEAAAYLVNIGMQNADELFRQARELTENIRRVKEEMLNAVRHRDSSKIQELLNRNPHLVNARTDSGDTPLLMALYTGSQEMQTLLLARGAQANFYEAASLGDTERVLQFLAEDRSLLHAYSHDGWTALHLAAFFGHRQLVERLLAEGASLGLFSQNREKNTPLHAAVFNRRYAVVELLLAHGADVNEQSLTGWSPLHLAANNGDRDMVVMLLQKGADRTARNALGQTAPQLAESRGHFDVANLLQEASHS